MPNATTSVSTIRLRLPGELRRSLNRLPSSLVKRSQTALSRRSLGVHTRWSSNTIGQSCRIETGTHSWPRWAKLTRSRTRRLLRLRKATSASSIEATMTG